MFCINCGAKNEDNAKFCKECGAKIAVTENTDSVLIEQNKSVELPINIEETAYTTSESDYKTFDFNCFKYLGRFMAKPIKTKVTVNNSYIETKIDTKIKLMNKAKFNQKVHLTDVAKAGFVQASTFSLRDVIVCIILILLLLMGAFMGEEFFTEIAASFIVGIPLLYWLSLSPAIEVVKTDKSKLHIFALPKENKQTMLELKAILNKENFNEDDKIKIPFNKKPLIIAAICVVITFCSFLIGSGSSDDAKIGIIKQSYFANHTDYTVSQLINDKYGDDVEWLIKVDSDGNEYVAAECYMDLEGEDVHIFTMLFAPAEENVYKVYQLFVTEESVSAKEIWGFVEALYENTYNLNNGADTYIYPEKADMNAVMVVTPEYTGDKTTVYQLNDNLIAAQQEADAEYQAFLDEMAALEEEARLEELYANALIYTNYGYGLEEPYYPTLYIFEDGTFSFDINQLSYMRTVTGTWTEIWVEGDEISLYFELDSEYLDKNTRFRLFSYDGGYSFTFDGCGENYGSLYGDDIWFFITY